MAEQIDRAVVKPSIAEMKLWLKESMPGNAEWGASTFAKLAYQAGYQAALQSQAAPRTLLEQYDLDQSPEYRKGYQDGRLKGYEVGHRYATEALQSQAAATPKVKYVPVDSKLRDTNWNHPNDDEPRTDACQKALEERGDSEGQGLDGFWKWGFRAGFNAALQSQAATVKELTEQAEPVSDAKRQDDAMAHAYALFSNLKLHGERDALKSAFGSLWASAFSHGFQSAKVIYTTPPDTQAVLHRALVALKEADKLVSLDCIDATIKEIESLGVKE